MTFSISSLLAGAEPLAMVFNDDILYLSTSGEFWKKSRIGGAMTMTVMRYFSIVPRKLLGSNRGSTTIGVAE